MSVTASGYVKQAALDDALLGCVRDAGYDTLAEVRDRVVRFDFSRADWFDLSTLLWLVTVLSRLRRQANILELRLPERPAADSSQGISGSEQSKAENLWSALQRWQFFDALSQCVDDPLNLLPTQQHQALLRPSRYSRPTTVTPSGEVSPVSSPALTELTVIDTASSEASDQISRAMRRYGEIAVRNNLRFHCHWSDREIDNFTTVVVPHAVLNVEHANATFAMVAGRADDRYLHLCVVDNGIGIPERLRRAARDEPVKGAVDSALIEYFAGQELNEASIREAIRDSELLVASTHERVTSQPERHRGMGLFYLRNTVDDLAGELRIRSGRAMVTFSALKGRGTASAARVDDLIDSPGTSLRIMLPRHPRAPVRRKR